MQCSLSHQGAPEGFERGTTNAAGNLIPFLVPSVILGDLFQGGYEGVSKLSHDGKEVSTAGRLSLIDQILCCRVGAEN